MIGGPSKRKLSGKERLEMSRAKKREKSNSRKQYLKQYWKDNKELLKQKRSPAHPRKKYKYKDEGQAEEKGE